MGVTEKELEEQIFEQIREKIASNHIILPSLPQIALRVRQITQQDDASVEELSKMIGRDAAISARLVKVANSAFNRGTLPVKTVKAAIIRLGIELVKTLVTQLSILQVMNSNNRSLMAGFVKDSLYIGAIAAALAERHPHLDGETALLGGLVHDIGRLPLHDGLEQIRETKGNRMIQRALTDRLHGRVGALLLTEWGFPEELVAVAADHEEIERQGGEQVDYVDIVITAMLRHHMTTGREGVLRGLSPAALPAVQRTLPDRKVPSHTIKARKEYVESVLS